MHFREMRECFSQLRDDADCRAVVLSAAGRLFTAGIKCSVLILTSDCVFGGIFNLLSVISETAQNG